MSGWTESVEALELLEGSSGPFERREFRTAWAAAYPEWTDASFGAELADGTKAAVALLASDGIAESVPYNYGGVVATRTLNAAATDAFLDRARRRSGARWVVVRSLGVEPPSEGADVGAHVVGWTSVVQMRRHEALEARFAKKARRSLRKAGRAGAEVAVTCDPEGFLNVYRESSAGHWLRYSDALITRLAESGIARCYEVRIESECVAAVLALTSPSHWTAWLAGQTNRGRSADANYLALTHCLRDAQRAGVALVNLGMSTGMPGVAHFKRRFDSLLVPVLEREVGSPGARIVRRSSFAARRVYAAGVRRTRQLHRGGRT